ncbi:MAG: four helix bundle protein [Synoicihabitans sp.]
MNEIELKQHTKTFSLRGLKLIDSLPESRPGWIVANQLGRSGTSVGANYRAACRSRSQAEMISKLSIVEEEADESGFWLEWVEEHGLKTKRHVGALPKEANELTAMRVASRRTLQRGVAQSKIQNQKSKIK